MRIAHILRKYQPSEWGGTETAIQRLLDGLRIHQTDSVVYCPAPSENFERDPLRAAGHSVENFRAFVPVWRISAEQRNQLVAIGGNLMSFDLFWKLRRAPNLSLIHTHALNRLGGIAATAARLRKIPFVVTIHGGVLDLPKAVQDKLIEPLQDGIEWGKVFGWIFGSRRVLERAHAIMTCNRREAALLKEKYPDKIIFTQPHGVPSQQYQTDHRHRAQEAFPQFSNKTVLLTVGRIDPVKNQRWLIEQLPRTLERHSNVHLVLVGACTDEAYGKSLKKEIRNLGLENRVSLTGGLPPGDARLIGLMQGAAAVILPSISETFGLVILEAWAAGAPVLSSRTSGATGLIRNEEDGWLFDLGDPTSFHARLDKLLENEERAKAMTTRGKQRVQTEFDCTVLAGRVKHLYEELVGEW